MRVTFYITTPIYYVNDLPHIGHSYTTVAADILARWHRLKGRDVFFLTGTDEHGAKILQAAQQNNETPENFCQRISGEFKAAWKSLAITHDHFIRTTDPQHIQSVQLFLQKLHDAGMIYKKKYEGLYCVPCEKYLMKDDLDENLCCPDHKQQPVHQAEENYFFRLSDFRDNLLERLSDPNHPEHIRILPEGRKSEIIGKLKLGLEDISISRSALSWGIPLPFDPSQTAYVWVDALLNYITGIGFGRDEKKFATLWPADIHLMAKDILWFHSIIWPAMLLAARLPLPHTVFAHGFFSINGDKMSKTLGNVISPRELIEKFGVDATRYLLVSLFPFGADGDISWSGLTEKYNSDLANNLGNLVARTLTMLDKYCAGIVPPPPRENQGSAANMAAEILHKLNDTETQLESLEFHNYISSLRDAIDFANRYIETSAPWKMAKANSPELPSVLYNLVQALGIFCIYLLPFMPETAIKIWHSIGESASLEETAKDFLLHKKITFPHSGARTIKPGILFPRFEKK